MPLARNQLRAIVCTKERVNALVHLAIEDQLSAPRPTANVGWWVHLRLGPGAGRRVRLPACCRGNGCSSRRWMACARSTERPGSRSITWGPGGLQPSRRHRPGERQSTRRPGQRLPQSFRRSSMLASWPHSKHLDETKCFHEEKWRKRDIIATLPHYVRLRALGYTVRNGQPRWFNPVKRGKR